MIPIKRIVCPIDLSADSPRTLRYAVALAQTYGARLVVCHWPGKATADFGNVNELVRNQIHQALTSISLQAAGMEWECFLLESDDLGAAVTALAASQKADLILMRSRRRPIAAKLLGSTAETIAHNAPCPVLVMHPDEREWMHEATGQIHLERVLVAVDYSSYSALALQYGLAVAQEYEAEVHLIHVLPSPTSEPEISWVGQETNAPYHVAARRLQDSVPGEVHLWCKVKHTVKTGRPYSEILRYAAANEIDLICLGAHGSDFTISSLFGSNVDRVLRQAQCPVLVAHPR